MRVFGAIAAISVILFVGCEKSPPPTFKVGDRVRTITGTEGVVYLRTLLLVEDVYYITIPERNPLRINNLPIYTHEGPFDAADLQLLPK